MLSQLCKKTGTNQSKRDRKSSRRHAGGFVGKLRVTARRELAEDADTFLLFCSKVRQYEVMQQIYSCKKRRKEKSLRGVFAEEGLCSERRRKEWDSSQPRKYLVHHLFSCSASIIENTENTSNCSIELWKMRQSCNSLCWPADGGVAAESSDSLLVFAVWTYVNRRTHTHIHTEGEEGK